MIVVSDTSALTFLIQIDQLHLLVELYKSIIIPTAVGDELLQFHKEIPVGIQLAAVTDLSSVSRLLLSLDFGEAEAIVLARELKADLLLMDENRRRKVAAAEGIKIIGTLGILVQARRDGVLRQPLAPLLDQLEALDFFVSDELREAVLRSVGEL